MGGRASDARFISETGLAAQIAAIAEPVISDLGFRLVRAVLSGRDGTTVQIMAERPDGTITVEECAVISRRLSPALDAHDPIQGKYMLEVSSPGIDRPLTKPEHYRRFLGSRVRVRTRQPIGGRRNFTDCRSGAARARPQASRGAHRRRRFSALARACRARLRGAAHGGDPLVVVCRCSPPARSAEDRGNAVFALAARAAKAWVGRNRSAYGDRRKAAGRA